ncbi:DUF2510 domain-containing protein [Microbacterium sp. QXD-8]|uniref:DUF2510 domain-containing protein n=1 Tax=Microbacterium psychrotolerans TaxID=3068321 RepID=A0ABU0Z4R5_9MICO|nr:DUF2510 domain-containing protein [Microbacterium sp. QXD-8]MDQ7879577.1 DUF2510 domain-containing protein [Microbacterium sp. QXD-8]
MTTTPPGWYDDGHGALRWWDGQQWTEHVAQPDAESSPAPTEAEIVAGQLGFEHETAPAPSAPVAQPGLTGQPAVAAQPGHAAAPQYAPGDPGYPQGVYEGAPAGGAFTAATEPRKSSKLWIVWVVIGVVLLGIVIAAAVLIPLLMLSAATAGSTGATDDERAAVSAVELYDDAWQDGDCDAFTAATTENFRAANGFTDCPTFEADAEGFDQNFDDYEVRVTAVETQADEIAVTTEETYTALIDGNGDATDPTPGSTVYHYTLVEADGTWLIDDLYYDE